MNRHSLAACLAAALAAWAAPARATPPATFTYSGFLTAPDGAPVTAPTDLTFRFYDAAVGGSQVGAAEVVTVAPGGDGYFAAVVGSHLPGLAALFANRVWMSIQVQGDDAEMTPRFAFTSVPSALAVDWSGVTNRPGACPADQFLRGFDAAGAAVCAALPAGNPGTVTRVVASLPLAVVDGASTPSLSMSQAGSATDGWLSAADWNTFDGKQARVTGKCPPGSSIQAIDPTGLVSCQADTNSGGTVTRITALLPFHVTDPTNVASISMTQANATTPGWLSSADWNTFNGKQARLNRACPAGQAIQGIDPTGVVSCYVGSGGTVTSLSANPPFNVAGTAAVPSISMTRAGSASDGWLSSTDWNTFNAKQARVTGKCPAGQAIQGIDPTGLVSCYVGSGGTVTSLSANPPFNVAGTAAVPSISMTRAGSASDGWLSVADWNTFNAKQARLDRACPAGEAIQGIDPTGAVSCQPVASSSGTVTSVTAGAGLTGGAIAVSGTLAIDPAYANSWSATQTFNGAANFNGAATFNGPATFAQAPMVGLKFENSPGKIDGQVSCPWPQSSAGFAPLKCQQMTAAVVCLDGRQALGGGCEIDSGYLEASKPTGAKNKIFGWSCRGTAPPGGSPSLTAWVICALLQ